MLSCTPGGRNRKYNSLNINTKIFPAWRFYGISGPGILRLWGWMRAWLHGGSVMAFRVKNYEILGVFI